MRNGGMLFKMLKNKHLLSTVTLLFAQNTKNENKIQSCLCDHRFYFKKVLINSLNTMPFWCLHM